MVSCRKPNAGWGDCGESSGRVPSNASQYCSQFPFDGVMGNPRAPDPVSSVGDDVTVDEAVAVVSRVDMDDD